MSVHRAAAGLVLGLLAAGAVLAHSGHGSVPSTTTAKAGYSRESRSYTLPRIRLVDAHGGDFVVSEELERDAPVLLNFIFTSCTAICPAMSGTFAQVQRRLDDAGEPAHFVSISLDPEQDTPARLREYAARFDASPRWRFVTGSAEDSIAVQRAFDVYRGDKMNHDPVTFIRPRQGAPWIRLGGFASATEIIDELHRSAREAAPAHASAHGH